ncbi:c-type cytochrome [Rhodohalobacter mucosus]|uniref:Cytochrome C n=1 Tax=Rhodohalobacter mucosus TaxID=2079485 RepID=A0A316TP69_9BACT|nr:cytochrome C [Rhodohalobacter mucosus]PWN06180.1 cytochrome C [Rhodohalobacter mucosus]
MKKVVRIVLYLLIVVIAATAGVVAFIAFALPNTKPAPAMSIELTEERIERGEYLANHVMLCMDCHAVRDFSLYAAPPKPGTEGAGGDVFDQKMGFPGRFVSRNLTPAALSDWSDGEIFRAITTGVSRDGTALFPVMPYPNYSRLAEDDIQAVIAYLRTLEPIENELEGSKPDFPVSVLINTMPVKADLQPRPSKDDVVNYGRYIITAASCGDCHTRMENGTYVGEPYAGGNEFIMPDGSVVRAANLTPHETGIGNWTEELFINRFKMYADSSYNPHLVEAGEMQTIMPWLMYAGMDEEDLSAMFSYLRTIEPVENKVVKFTPPPEFQEGD